MVALDEVVVDLFRNHNRELSRFVRRRVGREEAEDVVQSAYLHLLQKAEIESVERPRAYLFRIASNLATDAKRKSRTRLHYEVEDMDVDRSGPVDSHSETSSDYLIEIFRLQICLAKLPSLCRATFILNRVDGLTYPEIAARLDISLRTVNRNMVKASDHIRRHFDR